MIMFSPASRVSDRPQAEADLSFVVNPEIEAVGEQTFRVPEGCLPAGLVTGWVSRPQQVRLRGWTPDGARIDEVYEGRAAWVLSHEVDHLDGIRFPDRVPDDADLMWVAVDQRERFTAYTRAVFAGQTASWDRRTPRDQ